MHETHLIKPVIEEYFPVMRYTDLGSEPGNTKEAFEEMINFLEMNRNQKMHIYYLIGIENEEKRSGEESEALIKKIGDPLGLFYMYSLPSSILKRRHQDI